MIEKVLFILCKNYDCDYCEKNYSKNHSCYCDWDDDKECCCDCDCINCTLSYDNDIILNQLDEEKQNCTCNYYYKYIPSKEISNKEYFLICDIISFFSKKSDNVLLDLSNFGGKYDKKLFNSLADEKEEMDIYSDISANIKPFTIQYEYRTIEDYMVDVKKRLNKEILSFDMSLCCEKLSPSQKKNFVKKRSRESFLKPYFILRTVIRKDE